MRAQLPLVFLILSPVAIVLSLLFTGSVAQQAPPVCGTHEVQEKVRAIMYASLDDAFKAHVVSLYSVWMKDVRGQPSRAKAGIDLGLDAYVRGLHAVETWSLSPCR